MDMVRVRVYSTAADIVLISGIRLRKSVHDDISLNVFHGLVCADRAKK